MRTRRTRTEDDYAFNAVIAEKVMRHTDINQRLPKLILPLTMILLVGFLTPSSAIQADQALRSWYQVDVIIFKPRQSDLDDESWQEPAQSYPETVIAVFEPGAFKLSQLEQLEEVSLTLSGQEVPSLGRDDFLFDSQSNRQRNRRVIESFTGVPRETIAAPLDSDTAPDTDTSTQEPITDIAALIAEANPRSMGKLAFSRTEETSSLGSVLRRLNRSSRFKVLSHYSWIQPIDGEPTPIMVQAGKRYDDRFEIEGTLSLSRSRYLHVHTDLWYTQFEPKGGSTNPYQSGFRSNLPDETLAAYPDLVKVERERGQYYAARSHAMVQSRRMRSGEMHYIDHPLFGIVIQINRYTLDPEMQLRAASD